MKVERIEGNPGEAGRLRITEDMGDQWEVPCFVRGPDARRPGTLGVAQAMFENLERDISPGWSLREDLILACNEFLGEEQSDE